MPHHILPLLLANCCVTMDTTGWQDMPAQQLQRTLYVIEYMESGDRGLAQKFAGYKDSSVHSRIIAHLKECGTLAEKPHSRAPVKYTNKVFEEAVSKLCEDSDQPMATPELIAHLEKSGFLEPPTNSHNFIDRFEQWCEEHNLTLQVGARDTIFKITEVTTEERLQFVKEYIPQLGASIKLDEIIVCDETTIEESPHPKGIAHAWSYLSYYYME